MSSAEGHKVPPGQDQGKESPPPSMHNPRSAAQNERGVAERGTTWDNTMLWAAVTRASSGSSGPEYQQPQLSMRGLI